MHHRWLNCECIFILQVCYHWFCRRKTLICLGCLSWSCLGIPEKMTVRLMSSLLSYSCLLFACLTDLIHYYVSMLSSRIIAYHVPVCVAFLIVLVYYACTDRSSAVAALNVKPCSTSADMTGFR